MDFADDERALQEIKRTIRDYLKVEDEVDTAVRQKIRSLSKPIPEGSKEWEVLYKKYFEEEMARRRF